MNPGAKRIEKNPREKEETQIMHFPHWQKLADWRKDTLALEKNTIFRKRRSYSFKKILGFQSAYRKVGLASILL